MPTALGFWLSILLLCGFTQAHAEVTQRVVDIRTREGVTQRMIVIAPKEPAATVILFAGGHGGLQISPSGSFGWGEGNFLVRTRQLFADSNLLVVVVDAPSDRQRPPYLGGFRQNPWAWDAYFAFWLMAGISVVPDVIRYGRNRHADEPTHGLLNGGIRAMFATVLVFYIMWVMVAKQSLIAGRFFVPG